MTNAPLHLRVFLSSPGDLSDERALARQVFNSELPYDHLLRGLVTFEVVSWDDDAGRTPMPANLTPQAAVDRQLPRPSDCDVVLVILWSRMGTPLPEDYRKHNGERYLSGTEYEYEDARRSRRVPPPEIFVYWRDEIPEIRLDDPRLASALAEYEMVKGFLSTFVNDDRSIAGGYRVYSSSREFKSLLVDDMRGFVRLRLNDASRTISPSAENQPVRRTGSPYPGLRAFRSDEGAIFFGREREIDELIGRLHRFEQRFIAIVGTSGTGKSSLVKAGVLPRLAANAIPGSKDWRIVDFVPGALGNNPFLPLADAIGRCFRRAAIRPALLAERLFCDPACIVTLAGEIRAELPTWSEIVIFVDQLEELFTLAADHFRGGFINTLLTATRSKSLRVITTLRADYFSTSTEWSELAELLEHGTFPLAPPGSAALLQMIERPANRAGISLEEGLADEILGDAGGAAGALPLMAFVLDELYRRSAGSHFTLQTYHNLGGLKGAVGESAAAFVETLTSEQRATLPQIFQTLVHVDTGGAASRRRADRSDITSGGAVGQVVDGLIERRLLVAGERQGQSTMEVAHEALFEAWPQLRSWLSENRAFLQLRAEIEASMSRWHRKGHDQDFLLTGKELDEANQLASEQPDLLSPQVVAFVRESQEHARRRADRDEAGLRQVALRLAELARRQTANGDSRLGVLLALEALPETMRPSDRPYFIAAESALYEAIFSNPKAALLQGHRAPITAAAFNLRGDRVLTVSQEGSAYLWNGATGERLATLHEARRSILAASLSPDGQRILTAHDDGALCLWDGTTGIPLTSLSYCGGPVRMAAFSPQGRSVVTVSHDGNPVLWHAVNGAQIAQLRAPVNPVSTVGFSRDGERIATASADGAIYVWRVANGDLIGVHQTESLVSVGFSPDDRRLIAVSSAGALEVVETSGHAQSRPGERPAAKERISAVAFSPTRKWALIACEGGVTRLWDGSTGEARSKFTADEGTVTVATFDPGGTRLATGSAEGTVTLWDIGESFVLSRATFREGTGRTTAIGVSPEAKRVVAGFEDGTVMLWGARSARNVVALDGHKGPVRAVAFSRDGGRIVSSSDDTTGRIWDLFGASCIACLQGHSEPLAAAGFSPNGKRVVTSSFDGTARLWDPGSGKCCAVLKAHTGPVTAASFSSTGKRILTVSLDGTARLWHAGTGQPCSLLADESAPIVAARFVADGKRIASISATGTAQFWEASGRRARVTTCEDQLESVRVLALSSDGRRAVVLSSDGVPRLCHIMSRRVRSTRLDGLSGPPTAADFGSDDEQLLLSCEDGTSYLYNLVDQNTRTVFRGRTGPVTAGAISQDGRQIATASHDGSVCLWDATTGVAFVALEGHSQPISSVAFSPDGARLATASLDGSVRVWRIFPNTTELIAEARSLGLQPLTSVERARFFLAPR